MGPPYPPPPAQSGCVLPCMRCARYEHRYRLCHGTCGKKLRTADFTCSQLKQDEPRCKACAKGHTTNSARSAAGKCYHRIKFARNMSRSDTAIFPVENPRKPLNFKTPNGSLRVE